MAELVSGWAAALRGDREQKEGEKPWRQMADTKAGASGHADSEYGSH